MYRPAVVEGNPYKVDLTTLADGRRRLTVFDERRPANDYNPRTYTTVRNIDGSNRFMCDKSYWSFFDDYRNVHLQAAVAALLEPERTPSEVWTRESLAAEARH